MSKDKQDLSALLDTIFKMKDNKTIFKTYITKIAFPFFKNFTFHSEINFNFPLTILAGKNGSGKSSALQALYGAPLGFNLGDFWFSTRMDPIQDFGDIKELHCFFYEFVENEIDKTVLYQRIHHKKRNDPDYWETTVPRKKYKMKVGNRYKPINKNLIYLDFRGELSAFDKYFYFGNLNNLRSKSKQDFLRIKSKQLKNTIDNEKIHELRKQKQNELVINLTQAELKAISLILQEEYSEGKLISHKLFKYWGNSVILKKGDFAYSEAHAGSGEIAIVTLVHKVLTAQPESLILLDEPEVSLHPGAQKQLLLFLLEQIKIKKHQIIMSTHSPVFTEGMPSQAIKRFIRNPETNKIDILDECFPSEAFKFLGLSSKYDHARIHVEDALAQKIVQNVIENSRGRFDNFEIFFAPGGESYIKDNYIPYYSQQTPIKNFVLFDGDQKYTDPIIEWGSISNKNLNVEYISEEIKKFTNQNIKFIKDGGDGHNRDDQVIEAQRKYIEFYKKYVRFLPETIPEQIIWDDDFIENMIKSSNPKTWKEILEEIVEETNYKKKIHKSASILMKNTDLSISVIAIEDMLITHWIQKEDDNQKYIYDILIEFMEFLNK